MDFHGMKRKKLQALCKKHGIPANLKNIEMAARLASVFEETLTDSTSLSEDSLECDGIKDDLVVSKEAKRVRFSPENEVFEFTRSVKRCQPKNVRRRSKGPVQDLQQSGIELRRSKRILAKGKTIAGSNQNEANTRRGRCPDVTKALKLPRRIGSTANNSQQDSKVTGLMVLEQFEFEDDTSEGLSGSDQDGFKLEKTRRRSIRLASKAGALLPVQRSKQLADIEDKEEKLVKYNVKEVSVDSEFHDTEKYHRKDVQDEPKVEEVPRRSGRFVNDIDVQTNTQDQRRSIRLKARVANTSMGGEISDGRRLFSAKESKEERKTKQTKGSTVVSSQEGELVKNKTKEPLIDCKVQTTENFPSMKVQDVSKVEKVLRRSKRHRNDIYVLLDKRHEKVVKRDDWGVEKAPIVIEGNLVQKKTDETLENKRYRSAEPEMSQSAQFEQEEAGVANVESRGSSKKLKKMNQECAKDKPQGMIEKSPSSSETKAAESVMITENVLDSTLKKLVDSSQRTNTQELNSELMERNHEEKLEEDTVLMDAIEDDKKEVSSCSVLLSERSSPPSVQFAVSNPRAELGVPTGHILVEDIASTVIAKQDIKTKEEIHISIPRSELKENSFVAKLAEAEANLENSAECWNEIQSSKDSEKDSLEETIQAENLHGNFSEYNTENSKLGCISVSHCVNLEKLDEVKAESLEKSEQRSSCERGCKLNALELLRCSSTHFTSHSLKENNVKCSEVDKVKALSLPLPRNNDATENYLEVAGTCSMVSEECGPSTDNQNQMNDVLEELAITDKNEADELIEAKNIPMGFEGNLLLNSSSGSYVSGKTCILARTENEDEVGVPIATAFEKAISLTSDELTVQNHMNEKDEEMITRETTPISEETMNSSPENRKEYLNNDESGTLSKRQARRETILITRTQVKLTRHDMKENAPNSKIVQNLNVTAPRTSKRKPLQDLSKN